MKEIQSINRMFDILEALAGQKNGITVTNLARKVGLNVTTAYTIVNTAVRRGYVDQDTEGKRYHLGNKIVELSSALISEWDLHQRAIPIMEAVEEQCNESVYLGELRGFDVTEIVRVPGTHKLSILLTMNPGSAHCTALGKVLLAFGGERLIDEYITSVGLARYTEKTVLEPPALRKELEKVRAQGYAIDDEEYETGLSCIGAPVRNHANKVVAALSLAVPKGRFLDTRRQQLIRLIVYSANDLSKNLGRV